VKGTREPWTEDELATVRERYPHEPTAQVAAAVGRSVSKVYQCAARLGITKSEEFIASQNEAKRGKSLPGMEKGWFPQGNVPVNKGKRMPGWAPGRMGSTQFKRGEMAGAARARWQPIGTIMPDGEGYLRIKLRERNPDAGEHGWNSKVWKLYHHEVWESAHGPIPPKHIVVFKDRDRSNCTLDNLELISMKENAVRNHWKNTLPPDLAQVIMLNGAIKRKLRERSRNAKEEHNQ
jgi:hypothetical protein